MSKMKEVTIEQYREKLSSVCERASESTQKWLERHPGASRQEILDATYKITQAYGLAASTLAANKYDQDVALAEKQGFLKPGQIKEAEVWDPLGYGSIARAINGTLKNDSKEKLPDTIERMVKRFAEDTTLMNARRDGAEYAWIPAGDTCVFCLSLASNGWQRASKSTAQGNHADHIHPHCDCTFSVRFSKDTNVKGYHPEKIKAMIESQEGDTWDDKLNSLRRQMYAEKKPLVPKYDVKNAPYKVYTKEEITEMAKETENILSKHLDIPSKWSGKLQFTEEEIWQKEWNCDILTSYTTEPIVLLHEQIHARSISLLGENAPIIFNNFGMEEENAVQFLAEEICKKEGISFEKSGYEEGVNALRIINKEYGLFSTDYEMAKGLIQVPPQERLDFIIDQARDKINFEQYQNLLEIWKIVKKPAKREKKNESN